MQSDTDCLVSIPVLAKYPAVDSVEMHSDFNWLIWLISQDVLELCRTRIYIGMELHLRVVRHKKEEIHLGDHSAILAHCKSDRPAFVIEMLDLANGKSVKLMHFYAAMGLPKQHYLEQSLLARCYTDWRVAVAVIEVAQRHLPLTHCSLTAAMGVNCDDFLKKQQTFDPNPGVFWATAGMWEDDGLEAPIAADLGEFVRQHCLSHMSDDDWNILGSEIEAHDAEVRQNSEMGAVIDMQIRQNAWQ